MKDTILNEGFTRFMAKREMSKAKRLASMKIRLAVNMNGYKAAYEDIK